MKFRSYLINIKTFKSNGIKKICCNADPKNNTAKQ